jgi:hypothetical protein
MRQAAARLVCVPLLACVLAGCGAGDGAGGNAPSPRPGTPAVTQPPPSPTPSLTLAPTSSPTPARGRRNTLSCGATEMSLPGMPARLTPAGSFARVPGLTRRLGARGLVWRRGDERLYVGVVCGVRTAERFATLVPRSTLSAYGGRPALRWTARDGLRNLMWLRRPGAAVYIGATPGLAPHIERVAAGIG